MSAGLEHLDAREIRELRTLFFAQAGELLEQVQSGLLRIEHDGADPGTLRVVRRSLHTIKGDAGSMGFDELARLCHRLEDVLGALADAPGRVAEGVEVLFAGTDALARMLTEASAGGAAPVPEEVLERIGSFLAVVADAAVAEVLSEYQALQASAAAARGQRLAVVRIALHPDCREGQVAALLVRERLGGGATTIAVWPDPERPASASARAYCYLVAAPDHDAVRRAVDLPGVVADATVGDWQAPVGAACPEPKAAPAADRSGDLRVESGKVDRILDLVGELIIGRSMLEQVVRDAGSGTEGVDLVERLGEVSAYLDRAVGDLQKGALRMRMVPLRFLFKKFPRVVRDLAHQLGKSARLEVEGQETELDKAIVDALFEPLTHLIRNAVDHGIESREARRASGKPEEGRVTLRAYHEASRIVVEIADDGAGIDAGKLVRTAVANGLVDAHAAASLAADEASRLVFLSGLSTADAVTATSGRGVGMDVVKSALEAVKGTVEVESSPGAGTCFRLRLPLTMTVVRTLLFDAGGRLFALPVGAISEVARVRPGELTTVDGSSCLVVREQIVSVIGLGDLLAGVPCGGDGGYLLILALRGRRFGLLVDRLRWQQELVIKSVDERWIESGIVAGASILGDGRVVLILDALAVVSRAVEVQKARLAVP